MEAKDGRIIHLISSKPRGMSDQNWNWLRSLSFGAVVFGNPEKGHRPLPEIIANGDLDGDIYFVCWDTVILSYIKAEPISDDEWIVENSKAESARCTRKLNRRQTKTEATFSYGIQMQLLMLQLTNNL
mmetsp:Transcript_19622/g.40030  ORF Transcript_19622/g.40030 Transcript_19622/m.40030 type:complete len:128 (-) Transcript_19622:1694-2077(-)